MSELTSTPTPPDTTRPSLLAGDLVELSITRFAHGGKGVAHHDGRVVFVAGAVPGDVVQARITKAKARFAEARIHRIIDGGAGRVSSTNPCSAAAAGAGCCDLGAIDPMVALSLKERVLVDALERIAKLEDVPSPSTRLLPPSSGWRTRVRLSVDPGGHAGLRHAASHDIVAGVACRQNIPEVNAALDSVLSERSLHPGAEVLVAVDGHGTRHILEKRPRSPRARGARRTQLLEGNGTLIQRVGDDGDEFIVPIDGFWQAHSAAPAAYSEVVTTAIRSYLSERGSESITCAWDLYGGVGLFSRAIADAVGSDPLIELVDTTQAVTKAAEQPALRGLRVRAHRHRVDRALAASGPEELRRPQLVVLDPPRVGAGESTIAGIAEAAPELVVHIACDPASLARDVKAWVANGYRLRQVELIDAFPGTHHFETIALVERR